VTVGETITGEIAHGWLVLLGVGPTDTRKAVDWLAEKVANLRAFDDADGKMNRSVIGTDGEVLAVSQFTLLADTRKGKRPSFISAAPPGEAEPLFDYFCEKLREAGVSSMKTGSFGTMMDVALVNDGPVTILLER